ncbi:MAG: amylo-alpha-1,6-glucosidase, partial [Pirellulales bacterium]
SQIARHPAHRTPPWRIDRGCECESIHGNVYECTLTDRIIYSIPILVCTYRSSIAYYLNADETPDFSLRPNQFYAFDMIADQHKVARATRAAWEALVYPWGVASLASSEPFFHPFHKAWDHYHKDQAYHNGTIWLWNNGIAMQRMIELGQTGPAWALFSNMNRQALTRGVVGGMAENMDAYPQPGHDWPRLTGTYLQAWSNSEQLRIWYQHFLGVRPDQVNGAVTLAPRLTNDLEQVRFRSRVGTGHVTAHYRLRDGGADFEWQLFDVDTNLRIDLPGFVPFDVSTHAGQRLGVTVQGHRLEWTLRGEDGDSVKIGATEADAGRLARQASFDKGFEGVGFARPRDPSSHAVMHQVHDSGRGM